MATITPKRPDEQRETQPIKQPDTRTQEQEKQTESRAENFNDENLDEQSTLLSISKSTCRACHTDANTAEKQKETNE
jgi:hypothetical protein